MTVWSMYFEAQSMLETGSKLALSSKSSVTVGNHTTFLGLFPHLWSETNGSAFAGKILLPR